MQSEYYDQKDSSVSTNQPVLIQYKHGREYIQKVDKMQVTIIQATCNVKLNAPFVELHLGNQRYKTTVLQKSLNKWNEAFTFDLNFHLQIFATLQVDLYDRSTLALSPRHIGRSEIKLSLLSGLPSPFTSWYELWDKKNSHSNMSDIGRKNVMSDNVGAIEVNIRHPMQNLAHIFSNANDDESSQVLHAVHSNLEQSSNWDKMYFRSEGEFNELDDSEMFSLVSVNNFPDEKSIIEDQERMIESLEYFYREDDDDTITTQNSGSRSLSERIGSLLLPKETQAVLNSLNQLLAHFNQGIEIAHSSLLSGFLALEKFYLTHETPIYGRRIVELGKIEKAKHFYRYSLASYGWRGLNFFGKRSEILRDLTRSESDRKSILEFLSLPEDKLLYAELRKKDTFSPSFFIAHDEFTKSVVLSIRGTMSASDTFTDLICEYAVWKNKGYMHAGMKRSAESLIKSTLPKLMNYVYELNVDSLYIVGHSLGAGVASVMTMMILEDYHQVLLHPKSGKKIELKTLAFASPPSCSSNLCLKYRNIIQNYVFEEDIISRLSYGHVMDFKSLIVAAIEYQKQKVYAGLISNGISSLFPNSETALKLKESELNYETGLMDYIEQNRMTLKNPSESKMRNLKLSMVGSIYRLFYCDRTRRPFRSLLPRYPNSIVSPTSPAGSTSSKKSKADRKKPYKRAYIVETDLAQYEEMIIKRTMFLEHIPNVYDKAFERAFETLMMDLAGDLPLNIDISTENLSSV